PANCPFDCVPEGPSPADVPPARENQRHGAPDGLIRGPGAGSPFLARHPGVTRPPTRPFSPPLPGLPFATLLFGGARCPLGPGSTCGAYLRDADSQLAADVPSRAARPLRSRQRTNP